MEPLKFIIIEDKRLDEINLLNIISQYPEMEHLKTARNALEALSCIHTYEPELIFMDIEIPGGTGLELARTLKNKDNILVFVTSYPEFALEGFTLSAIDYILKPLSEERFAMTYERIMEFRKMKELAQAQLLNIEQERILIREGYNRISLQINDILYLEAMQDYTKEVTKTKKYMVNSTLAQFMEQQKNDLFIRIHRSYSIVRRNIRAVHFDKIVCDDFTLPIGKTYRVEMNKFKL